MTNTRKLAGLAADYIEKHGWCQALAFRKDAACLLYAIHKAAAGAGEIAGSLRHELAHRLCKGLVEWNDTPGRTKEEVIALLREYATPAPLSPESPIWTDPAPEEPNPVKVPAYERNQSF